MSGSSNIHAAIEDTIARLTAELQEVDQEINLAVTEALEDWLITLACEDYDTIDLSVVLEGKVWRKQFKHLRDSRRNLEKMIAALQVLQAAAHSKDGDRLQKKFDAEQAHYRL